MADLAVLRLYFSASEVLKHDSWWRRMVPQKPWCSFAGASQRSRIEQALLHRVIGGYLKNQRPVMDNSDIPPARLPQCLELVAEEDLLQAFLKTKRKPS